MVPGVPLGHVRVVRRFLVVAARVVLGRFLAVLRRHLMPLRGVRAVLASLRYRSHFFVFLLVCPRNRFGSARTASAVVPLAPPLSGQPFDGFQAEAREYADWLRSREPA